MVYNAYSLIFMSKKYSFIKEHGASKTLFCELIKDLESKGKSKSEIQSEFLLNKIVKSVDVLSRHYRFYERNKDHIGWI